MRLFLFISGRTQDCLHVLAIVNSATVKIGVVCFFQLPGTFFQLYWKPTKPKKQWGLFFPVILFSRYTPKSRFLDHNLSVSLGFQGNSMLYSTLAVSNFYFQQQCRRAPFSAAPFQHLLFVDFLMIAVLTDKRWYFWGDMICFVRVATGKDLCRCFFSECE